MEHGSYGSYAAIVVAIGLGVISFPLLRRAARAEVDAAAARLIWIAFGCKMLSTVARYAVNFGLYDGQADSTSYASVGALLARQFRNGDFVVELGQPIQGTGFIMILTGVV